MNSYLQPHLPNKISNFMSFEETNKKPNNQIQINNISNIYQLPKQHLIGMTSGIYDTQGNYHPSVENYNFIKYSK